MFAQKLKLFIALPFVVLVLGEAAFLFISWDLPSPEQIAREKTIQSTKIYDRSEGTLLYEIHGEEKRTVIPAEDIPDVVKHATIAIEDAAFYSHPAFDWRGVIRAVLVNLLERRTAQGGSTITQQLARALFLKPDKTIYRKIKELVLAMRLEERYSKDEILVLYLNQVPYGAGAYGIEAASLVYFNKHAKDLSLNEAALLSALPRAPSYYSPWGSHVDELEGRKNLVLKRMRELNYIDDEELLRSQASMPKIAARPEGGIKAPHFVAYIQDYVGRKYGEEFLEDGGFKIVTSLDSRLQEAAEKAVKTGGERNIELYNGRNAALVAMDPMTGQVLAMVGSRDYFGKPEPAGCKPGVNCLFEGNFNVAVQGLRQPGSALKPFAYLTALEKGLTPETIVWDTPTEFTPNNPSCPTAPSYEKDAEPPCYHPQNFDEQFRGPVLLKEGLAQSINVPSVKVLYLAGVEDTIKNTESFGISTLKDRSRFGLSLVLGGGEVKLIELAQAYSVLAREGVKPEISPVLKITRSDGSVLEEYQDKAAKVIDPQYPRLITDILSDPELRAPLFRNSLSLTQVPGHQVALKTGTTNNYVDAWAMGYTPDLVVGVWAGNNNREPLQRRGSSILAAVPIWHDFFASALKDRPLSVFSKPNPIFAENPALRGELARGDYHDLLYYLGRLDDPQFINWEEGLKNWLTKNSVDSNRFLVSLGGSVSAGAGQSVASLIQVVVGSPGNGSFVSGDVPVEASINSARSIEKIELYLNNELVDDIIGNLGTSPTYKKNLTPKNINLQNLLVLRVTDSAGGKAAKEIILYKRSP
ncbi:MAG: transglycosylase domain-containing protein [Candidatus Colwellbacteria bacterium]|nr:transglycosylase domain-containing protein [Candidatus Colwellbacteria bacterium]